MYQKFITKFNTISFAITMTLCALVPLFFLPGSWGGIVVVKGVILYVGVFLAFSFWLLAQFVSGSLRIPKHSTFIAIGLWVVFAFLSALFSKNISVSLWGRGFVIDSFATVLVLSLFTFLIATFAREQKRLVTLFLSTFVGAVTTVLLQVILYLSQKVPFVANNLSHVANQGTLVGSWVDFAYFVTLTFLLALLMYEVLIPKGFFKILSLCSMVLSIVVMVFLNFKAAWIIAIVSSLLVFVYKSSVERSVAKLFSKKHESEPELREEAEVSKSSTFPIMSFVALLIALFFFLSSNSIGSSIAQSAGINFTDIRPSFSASTQVMRSALWRDPVLGAGAGRFGEVWNLYHPLGINQTQFWNNTFDSGYSMLQTLITTNGVLAGLALLSVIIFSLIHGFKLFSHQFPDRFSRFIAVASLIMFGSFGALFIFSSPGLVLIVLGFLYLGLLLGVSALVGRTKVSSVNYLKDPRLSFFSILILVLATMGGFSAAYFSGNRFASVVMYNRALRSTTLEGLQRNLDRAISLSPNDIYWRTRAALFVRQFTNAANVESADKALLQGYFDQAEQSAGAAVAWDSTNANNWLALSQVYQLIASSTSTDAFNAAKNAADQALALNPNNPLYHLNEARVAMINENKEGASSHIAKAIELKPNYLEAFVLRAQLRISSGETDAAIEEISRYITVAPYDPEGYMLLGQAYAVSKQYQGALDSYNRARQLNPNDPNALLALIDTLTLMGRKEEALKALETFSSTFPMISGIEQKRAQIQSASTVIDSTSTEESTGIKTEQ